MLGTTIMPGTTTPVMYIQSGSETANWAAVIAVNEITGTAW